MYKLYIVRKYLNINREITEAVLWHIFIKKTLEIFENYKVSRAYINYIYAVKKDKFLIDLLNMEDEYIWYCRETGVSANTFKEKILYIRKKYEEYKKNIKKYTVITTLNEATEILSSISNKFEMGTNLFELGTNKFEMGTNKFSLELKEIDIPRYNLSARKYLGYKWSKEEEILTCIKYYTLYIMTPGNQWSLFNNKMLNIYLKLGYKIELFGSPFNARLPYFGSLYESDEPFGSIGTYEKIIKKLIAGKAIIWRNTVVIDAGEPVKMIVNPPSGDLLIMEVCKNIIKLLNARKAEIRFYLPGKSAKYLNILTKTKYFKSSQLEQTAYDFHDLSINKKKKEPKEIDMRGREWYNILLTS